MNRKKEITILTPPNLLVEMTVRVGLGGFALNYI